MGMAARPRALRPEGEGNSSPDNPFSGGGSEETRLSPGSPGGILDDGADPGAMTAPVHEMVAMALIAGKSVEEGLGPVIMDDLPFAPTALQVTAESKQVIEREPPPALPGARSRGAPTVRNGPESDLECGLTVPLEQPPRLALVPPPFGSTPSPWSPLAPGSGAFVAQHRDSGGRPRIPSDLVRTTAADPSSLPGVAKASGRSAREGGRPASPAKDVAARSPDPLPATDPPTAPAPRVGSPSAETRRQRFRLKRTESVFAEAAKARGPLWRVQLLARRATGDVVNALTMVGHAAATMLGEKSVRAVRQFESMPRKKQILWVAAPYAVVLLLVLLLVQLRVPSRASAEQAFAATAVHLNPTPAPALNDQAHRVDAAALTAPGATNAPATAEAAAVAVSDGPAGAGSAAAPTPAEPVASAPPSSGDEHRAEDSVEALVGRGVHRAPPGRSQWHKLPMTTVMRAKPDSGALKIAKLRSGSRILVFPDFRAREGWVLAQRSDGEVGFIVASHLEGKRDPRFEQKHEKSRHRGTRGS